VAVSTEEEYFATLDRIIKGSILIANPSTEDGARIKYRVAYDRLVEDCRAYRRAIRMQMFPGLKEVYEQIGYKVAELKDVQPAEEIKPTPTENQQAEPEPKPVPPKPPAKLSDFLDD
jgi:hypothetical protein